MSAKIFCIGANHKTADIALREAFVLEPEPLIRALPEIKSKHNLEELFVISTCNRFELVGTISEANATQIGSQTSNHNSYDPIALWIDLHQAAQGPARLDRAILESISYHLTGMDAVRHAFRVASSLDSLIPGETQITGQFKDAIEFAQKAQTMGPVLSRMSQDAISIAKKVRSQTDIGKRTVSIGHAAVTLAKRMFHDLSACRFLIVGAGEMARVAAEHAKSYKPKSLQIVNRSPGRALELASSLGLSSGFGFDHLESLIRMSDVIIVATSAPEPVITPALLKKSLANRDSAKPLFLVDISLPRNIDPNCRQFDDVYLFDIDDLKQVVEGHLAQRKAAAEEATVLVDIGAQVFEQWLATHDVSHIIQAWKDHVQHTLEREASKTLSKEIFQTLSEKQSKALKDMIDAMTSRLSGDFAQGLRKGTAAESFLFATDLKHYFGLEDARNEPSKKDSPL